MEVDSSSLQAYSRSVVSSIIDLKGLQTCGGSVGLNRVELVWWCLDV